MGSRIERRPGRTGFFRDALRTYAGIASPSFTPAPLRAACLRVPR